jgi:hypothetical protein
MTKKSWNEILDVHFPLFIRCGFLQLNRNHEKLVF